MNDPWDVKCVTQSNQYVSCMKINGVPLLPPLLSKECRKEMQYYKVLAKEVEKRISILKPYVNSESGSDGFPELTDLEKGFELPKNEVEHGFDLSIEKITAVSTDSAYEKLFNTKRFEEPLTDAYTRTNIKSNITIKSVSPINNPPKLIIDLSLNINETGKNLLESIQSSPRDQIIAPLELPEHDCDYEKKSKQKEKELDIETIGGCVRRKEKKEYESYKPKIVEPISDPISVLKSDGPTSLSSKSFTGSLNDIRTGSLNDSQPRLIRQSSYTLLQPSPQLLAHLEVQSIKNGIDMISISMSESQHVNTPNKKRRSWDLETAKVKWSSMAMQLNQTTKAKTNCLFNKNHTNEQINQVSNINRPAKKSSPPLRSRSVAPEQRRNSFNSRLLRTEPITKPKTVPPPLKISPSNKTVKEPSSPQHLKKKDPISPKNKSPPIPEAEDPATKVRELYEKIQQQQLAQMANLVEKQKKEQALLQQAFENQNSMLFKQLKTICPKSPVEVKEAWGDKIEDPGPVSLSQLISKSPSTASSPVAESSSTISRNTNKSKDVKNNIKTTTKVQSWNKIQSPQSDRSRTRTHSPNYRNASRKLNYESSASEKDFDNILTDRTNDTMADILNVSFPSDSEEVRSSMTDTIMNKTPTKRKPLPHSVRSTDSAIRNLENSIQLTMNTMNVGNPETAMLSNGGTRARPVPSTLRPPTAKERAAATTIVAYAKGYLLRRLMRTERVQSTVQTIRDALLCALQLHQDREGIRGADVDLHRRLIQQITAACYTLHDTCVASSAAARCAVIAADRARRRELTNRMSQSQHNTPRSVKHTNIMSKSHSGSFPSRVKRISAPSAMCQSYYETSSVRKWSRVGRASR